MTDYSVKTMPDRATIIERMSSVFGGGSDEGSVIARFADKIADSIKVAPGVNLAFQFAIHDITQIPGATPMLSAMMNLGYDMYMSALFEDDPAFAAECIEWHNKIVVDIRNNQS